MKTMSPAQTSQKAKSRLAQHGSGSELTSSSWGASADVTRDTTAIAHAPVPRVKHNSDRLGADTKSRSRLAQIFSQFWSFRLHYLLLLFLGLLGYAGTVYILWVVHPTEIANILFYHSYLPLLLVSFAGHFFFLSFIFLHTRRAVLAAVVLTVVLFLKLQAVIFTFPLLLTIFAAAILLEASLFFIFKR